MAKLIIPENPAAVGRCTPLEPMRVTVDGKPGVGLILGQSDKLRMLFISKEGSISEFPLKSRLVTFVDYLLESESISIFGSAKEHGDDDLPETLRVQERDLLKRPPIEEIGLALRSIPDFVPYHVVPERQGSGYVPWDFMNVPTRDGSRITLAKPAGQRPTGGGYYMLENRAEIDYRATAYLDEPIEIWKNHYNIGNLNVVDPSTWPV